MALIKFGTSGWRAIIGEEFTFRNVEIVARAIADYVTSEPGPSSGPQIVIGYDGRFCADAFARAAALIFAAEGVRVMLPHRSVPTPVVSMVVREHGLSGGIVLTASHNPPEYGGIKFNPASGAPAPLEVTRLIETRANAFAADSPTEPRFPTIRALRDPLIDECVNDGSVEWYDPYPLYRSRLFDLVDADVLRSARLNVVADVFYGAGRGYLPDLLQEAGCRVTTLHDEHNPLFGGIRPDPVGENVRELAAQVRNSDADLGLAVDGDADRFGIVDANGDYVHANHVLALVCDYVAESRGWKGEVVRTVATSHLLDSVAAYHGCTITQTPTGFKFIGGRLVEAPKSFVFGGEESNGMTVRGHTPEKDGILACLLVAEMVAAKGISLRGCLDALFTRFGERFVDRIDLELPEERKQALLSRLESDPPSELGGVPVTTMDRMDGFKLILSDGSFLAIRASGTEPLVRCYLDAASAEAMARLTSASRELVANQ